MTSICRHCGAEPHESRKRTFACGTTYSGTGVEYRTASCKLTEAANTARDTANAERDAALADRARYKAAMEAAQADAAEAREIAVNAQKFVDAETHRFRVETLGRVRDVLFPEEAAKALEEKAAGVAWDAWRDSLVKTEPANEVA